MFTQLIKELDQTTSEDEYTDAMYWWLEDLKTGIINEILLGLNTVTQRVTQEIEKVLDEAVNTLLEGED